MTNTSEAPFVGRARLLATTDTLRESGQCFTQQAHTASTGQGEAEMWPDARGRCGTEQSTSPGD
jgi:hypothetical protein